MRKLFSCLFICVAVAPVFGQDAVKKLSFKSDLVGAKTVLSELSKQAGVQLSVGKSVENEPLFVRIESMELDVLLKRIALACSAEWEKTSDGLRLVRSANLQDKQRQAYHATRAEALKRGIASFLATHAKDRDWTTESVAKLVAEERAMRQQMMQDLPQAEGEGEATSVIEFGGGGIRSPAGLALIDVISRLSPVELGKIPPNGRWVFSSEPNKMQRTFGFDTARSCRTFADAHNLLVRMAGDNVSDAKVKFRGGLDLQASAVSGPIGKMLLIAARRGGGDRLDFDLKISDAAGKVIGTGSAAIAGIAAQSLPDKGPDASATEIKLSADGREFAKLMSSMRASSRAGARDTMAFVMSSGEGDDLEFSSGSLEVTRPISIELLKKLSNPESSDPHSIFLSEALSQAFDGNVVACLPDSSLNLVAHRLSSGMLVTSPFVDLDGVKIELSAGCHVLSAADPYSAAESRMERPALGRFLRATLAKGYADLGEMSDLALHSPAMELPEDLQETYLNLLIPISARSFDQTRKQGRGMLEICGTLSPDQRKILLSGQSVAFGSFDRVQMKLAHGLVFGAEGHGPLRGPIEGRSISVRREVGGGPMPDDSEKLSSEVTERLRNGIPSTATLAMQHLPKDGVFSRLPGARDGRFMSGGELGMHNAMAQKIGSDMPASVILAAYTKFRPATITRMPWTLALVEGFNETGTLRNAGIVPSASELTFEQLSEQFRKSVQAGFDAMKNVKFNQMHGGDGPPPAR